MKKWMMLNIVFYIIIIVSIYLDLKDKDTVKCMSSITKQEKTKLVLILIFHHIINIFANFGYLLKNRTLLYIYIVVPFLMFTYWWLNNDKCHVTVWANNICGWKGDKNFNDLFNIAGLKKTDWWFSWGHLTYSAIGICIALYRIKHKI